MKTYIYFLINEMKECIYIGKTGNLKTRISQHFKRRAFDKCLFVEMNNTLIANVMEMYYIAKYNPLENIEYKDILGTVNISYFDELLKENAYLYDFRGKHKKMNSVTLVERDRNVPLKLLMPDAYTYKVYKRVKSDNNCYKTKLALTEIGVCDSIEVQYDKLMKKVKQGKMEYDFKLYYFNHCDKVEAQLQYALLSLELYKNPEAKYIEGIADFIGEYFDSTSIRNKGDLNLIRYSEYLPESLSVNCEIKDKEVIEYITSRGRFSRKDKSGLISYDEIVTESLKKNMSRYKLDGITYVLALLDKNDVVIDFNIINPIHEDLTDEYFAYVMRLNVYNHLKKYAIIKGLLVDIYNYNDSIRLVSDVVEIEEGLIEPNCFYINYEIYFIRDGSDLNNVQNVLLKAMEKGIPAKEVKTIPNRLNEIKSIKTKTSIH